MQTTKSVPISDLKFAEYNPRTINENEYNGLKASLKIFGQVENIVVNKDMTIISGHQRTRAWKELGNETIVAVILDLDKPTEKKLNVVMNSHTITGTYDELKLNEMLEEMKLDEDYTALRLDKLEPLDLSDQIDFDNIRDNRARTGSDNTQIVTCPNCSFEFNL